VWKPKTILLPEVTDEDPDDELQDLALDGWGWRDIDARAKRLGEKRKTYMRRIKHELGVIGSMGFAPYFLVVHDAIEWARSQGIMVGPGRGSAAGSLVCYLLGITSIDPLEHGLLFERFLTPGRKDWPDIDVDFEDRRRHEVFAYLRERYGDENVAQISTLSRMKGKSALRDVARAHGLHTAEVDAVASTIVEVLTRDAEVGSIERALEGDVSLREFETEHPAVIEQAVALEGHIRHVGIHPAGVVTSPIPLTDFVPLERRLVSGEEVIVTAFDKYTIPELGLVKLDFLGLKTLSVLADARRLVEERTGEVIDYEALTFDDPDVLEAFTDGDSVGVFQFDSPTARAATAGVVFESFEDVVALNALNRPGTAKSGLADEWRKLKAGEKGAKQNPIIAGICSDTLGVIVYQEHVIKILQDLAGYTPEEAGRLRKAISKSAGAGYLEADRPVFVKGAGARGMEREEAEALWSQIEQFGAYGFNKSHAAAYGAIAYWCQWMKLRHPAEFFCALLTHESEPAEASRVSREAERRGVPVCPPDVNVSRGSWTVSPAGELVAGLEMIKGVGSKPAENVGKVGPFDSFVDFIVKVNRRSVHRGVMVALAKAGALADIVPNAKWFIENAEALLKRVNRKGWAEELTEKLEASRDEDAFDDEDAAAMAITVGISGTNPMSVLDSMRRDLLRARGDWHAVEDCFDGSLIAGVLTAKKVGTSGKRRWASVEIEGDDGARVRLRLDDEGFQRFRPVLDAGLGALIAARISVGKGGGARPMLLVDLLEMRRKWRAGEPFEWYELAMCRAKEHPASSGVGKWWRGGKALVLRVNERRDRNGRWMAFVSCDGGVGAQQARELVVFADLWEECEDYTIPGKVVAIKGKLDKRGTIVAKSIEEA
jgi:DNA-directed DNA polymerase III PolC